MVHYKNPVPGLDPTIAANLAAYGSPWGGAQRQVEKDKDKDRDRGKKAERNYFFIVNDFKSKLKIKR